MRRIVFILFILISFSPSSFAKRINIRIDSQTDFNNIQAIIVNHLNTGVKELTISILPGTYVANENHIFLSDIDADDLKLSIIGKDVVIIPNGLYYKDGDLYGGFLPTRNSWISDDEDISIWSHAYYSDGEIEVVSIESKLCRLKTNLKYPSNIDYNDSFICITKWFRSGCYKIEKIDNQYIYFIATDLAKSNLNSDGYNINDDYYYYGIYPRFKLHNVNWGYNSILIKNKIIQLPTGVDSVYEGAATRFLSIKKCKIKTIVIKGLKFRGGRYTYNQSTITFDNVVSNNIRLDKCKFVGSHSNLIDIKNTNNCYIQNCEFKDCYYYGICVDNNSANVKVNNNSFNNMGKGMQNTFSVLCSSSDYLISNNKFLNFGYGGIGAGVWYGDKSQNRCNGVVEKNELYYSYDYINSIDDFGLMDGGAIYLWTKNDNAIIRYNRINNYTGLGGNRGIFCDDGAYGFEIYGNVITNLYNCDYSIASRREASVENSNKPITRIVRANVNNVIRENIIEGGILFEGHEDINNGCEKGRNYFIVNDENMDPNNKIKNISLISDDIILHSRCDSFDSKLLLPRSEYRIVRKSSEWKHLKNYVGCK